jgi:hypothetical protein
MQNPTYSHFPDFLCVSSTNVLVGWLFAPVVMVRYKGKFHVSSINPNRQADE